VNDILSRTILKLSQIESSYLSFQIFSLLPRNSWKLFDVPLPSDVLAGKNGLVCTLDFSD